MVLVRYPVSESLRLRCILIVYQLGGLVLGAVAFNVWTIVAAVLLVLMLFMLFRPDPYKDQKSYTRSSVEAAS